MKIEFVVDEKTIVAYLKMLIVAGWTGRDRESLEHHIAELEAIGVARPRSIPTFYRCGVNLLTTDRDLQVTGADSSGEAEFVLVSLPQGMHVGVGSDHTDRKVEAYGVTVSKQMCPKPVSRELWPLNEVADHWDQLILRSYITRGGERKLYQEGAVTRMLAPEELIAKLMEGDASLPVGTAMYCGTMPLKEAMGPADLFECELEDTVRGRVLRHAYTAQQLPYSD